MHFSKFCTRLGSDPAKDSDCNSANNSGGAETICFGSGSGFHEVSALRPIPAVNNLELLTTLSVEGVGNLSCASYWQS